MPNPYVDGSFIWYWYEWGLPIFAAALALAIMVSLFLTTDRRAYGVIMRTLIVLTFIGTIPMAEERIGIGISVTEGGMAVTNLLGVIGSVIVGSVHFVVYGRRRKSSDSVAVEDEALVQSNAPVPIVDTGTVEIEPEPEAPATQSPTSDAGATIVSPVSTYEPAASEDPVAPPAWLVFQSGPSAGQTIPLAAGGTMIGRGPDNDIVINDDGVSRQHAEITFVDGQFRLTDIGSSGGTLVEGSQAETAISLESGAAVRLGATDVVFMQGSPSAQRENAPDAPTATGPASGQPSVAAANGDAAQTMVASAPPAAPVMAWLAVVAGPSKGVTHQIHAGSNNIGRGQDNDLVLTDSGVSRQHALVVAENEKLTLFDLASTGSTELNGQKLEPAILSTTSQIKLGESMLMLVDVEASESAAPLETSGATDATIVGMPAPVQAGGILIVQSGPDSGKTFQLAEGDNVIGRSEGSIILSDPLVSRRHAVLRRSGEGFIIYDLGSVAGTVVDGVEVTGDDLKGGDKIVVGATTVIVMDPLSVTA